VFKIENSERQQRNDKELKIETVAKRIRSAGTRFATGAIVLILGFKGAPTNKSWQTPRVARRVWGASLSITHIRATGMKNMKLKEVFMKKNCARGMLAAALVFALLLASCATFEVVDGVPQNMGVISKSTLNGKEEIASYWMVGPFLYGYNIIFNAGYEKFIAETKGKRYDIQVKQYWGGIVAKVTAVAK
jgi:hypothetical protein